MLAVVLAKVPNRTARMILNGGLDALGNRRLSPSDYILLLFPFMFAFGLFAGNEIVEACLSVDICA